MSEFLDSFEGRPPDYRVINPRDEPLLESLYERAEEAGCVIIWDRAEATPTRSIGERYYALVLPKTSPTLKHLLDKAMKILDPVLEAQVVPPNGADQLQLFERPAFLPWRAFAEVNPTYCRASLPEAIGASMDAQLAIAPAV